VLVIDDSATVRDELRSALEGAGYSVLTAESGEDGLRIAANARPTAVIVDGVLPGIDGAAVVRRLPPDAAVGTPPCLMLTGSRSGVADELMALDAGADAYVRKSGDAGVVFARFTAMLRSAGTQGADIGTSSVLGPKKVLAIDDSPTFLEELAG